MEALDLATTWPVEQYAVVVRGGNSEVARHDSLERPVRLASVSKLITAWALLVALEEGSLALDQPAGPDGSTIRHLLAHTSGLPFEGHQPVSAPGSRRIYSNTGFDLLAHHLEEATGLSFASYLDEAVLSPLGMISTRLDGSAAKDMVSTLDDVSLFAAEMLAPRLIHRSTYADAISAQFPDVKGVVPAVGQFDPCPWGLGPELKGAKHPHWMGSRVSAATFGHFGGTGTFVWVDPTVGLACAVLAERGFDTWGMTHWPRFNDAVVDEWIARRRP